MDNQLFFKSPIATSPKRTHECRTVSEAPENCAKMPKSIRFRAFGGTGEPFVRLDFRMGQRAFSSERQRTGAFLTSSSPHPGGSSAAWTERLRALWKHCQKEQFKAEGLFRLMKDIDLWIAAYKKLSPGSKNGGERPKGTLIKALETLRDSVINEGSPTGRRQSWPKGHETQGTGGEALGPEGTKETSLAPRKKSRRPEMDRIFPHTSLPRVPRTHKVSRALWVVDPSDASLAPRLTQKDKDILVQEVIRSILETVYEPYFLSCSHGFRPGRSQHTCLKQIRRDFVGTVWFVEGETQCFNEVDKQVLMGLMRRRIRDNRFLNPVQKELETSLKAAVGAEVAITAKGGVGPPPLLCNIVLHEPDLFVMRLKRIVDGGQRRAVNLESKELWRQSALALIDRTPVHIARVTSRGGTAEGTPPPGLGHPQGTRQINYVRFADDFPIGVIGPRALAERIRSLVTRFLEVRLKLSLDKTRESIQSRSNTLPAHYVPMGPKETWPPRAGNNFTISAHAATGKSKKQIFCIRGRAKKIAFPGYLISRDSTYLRRGRRYGIRRYGGLSLLVDMRKVINRLSEKGFCDKSGHPKPNFAYFQYPQTYSVARIASILRGLANYYHLANSKRRCVTRLSYILRTSLAKTYAAKFKLGTAAKVFAKGGRDLSKPIKARKGLNKVSRVPNRGGAGSERHFSPAIPYTRYGQIKLPDTKPLTKNWQPSQFIARQNWGNA
uniref:reverse transcriptase n=1 Tax=Calypogeia muelleriana TaxID=56915 RepID=UPI002A806825|nr:reverse transcriptase [Calypogeia muelleriana]UYI31014.1 reverse transcriptase [Calypogeia muelleriana]UYI31056.1 reverse transcriptase [Calypogeia muelleriana]